MHEERVSIPVFELSSDKLITRSCLICGKEYSYKGGTNHAWKDAGHYMGVPSPLSSPTVWPNDLCPACRTVESALKYINALPKDPINTP